MEIRGNARTHPAPNERTARAGAAELGRLYETRGRDRPRSRDADLRRASGRRRSGGVRPGAASHGNLRAADALEPWVWTIVLNEARRRSRTRELEEQSAPQVAPDDGEDDQRAPIVRAAVRGLPARQREIAFLRYYADLDEQTIASVLGVRRGTVAATLHTVRSRVRAAIDEEGGLAP